jgi:endoglucanase
MKIKNIFYIVSALLAISIQGSESFAQDSANTSSKQGCSSVTQATCDVVKNLGRGINLGNMLEAPQEGDWGVRIEPRYIELVANNFNNVRVPVRWSNHASRDEAAILDGIFAARVDNVIDSLIKKNVYVVLDMHHYSQLFGDQVGKGEFEVEPEILEKRMINIWRQLAERYKDRSPKLIFELLNEPHGKLDSDRWNKLLADTLAVVRVTNPNRIVMIGPTYWNAPKDFPKLKLPNDRNLIVQFHSYLPFNFTHQGVTYLPMKLPVGVRCCDDQQRIEIAGDLDKASQWSIKHGYPVYLGEFGATKAADNDSRAQYARAVRDEAESRGIPWAYWELVSSFGIFDPQTNAWNPELRRALLNK